jgi:hypothetical protein
LRRACLHLQVCVRPADTAHGVAHRFLANILAVFLGGHARDRHARDDVDAAEGYFPIRVTVTALGVDLTHPHAPVH